MKTNAWKVVAVLMVGAACLVPAPRASCAVCLSTSCFRTSNCMKGCVCIKSWFSGDCMSIEYARANRLSWEAP